MNKQIIITAALSICILLSIGTQTKSDDKTNVPTISVTKLDITDKTLKLCYEIRNESEQNVWILVGFEKAGASAELFMEEDGQILLLRRRLDVPFSGGGNMVFGRYVLMRPGESQIESITRAIPVHPEYGFTLGKIRQSHGLVHARRVAIEIGYYNSELPVTIRRTLEEADRIGMKPRNDDDRTRFFYFRGSLYFNALSEVLRQRDEEIFLPYTYQWFKGEQVVRKVVEDVRIPYEEKEDRRPGRNLPDISACTRIEIQYRPSMLEYFFPYAGQQSLLNPEEIYTLQSVKTIVVQDSNNLKTFVSNINKGNPINGIVRERTMAQVDCYRDDELMRSFPIYNDYSVVIDFRDRFRYHNGFPSLRMLTPQIKPFELRMQCAGNLRNLWHRLRLYYKAVGQFEMLYPPAVEWCDAVVEAYNRRSMLNLYIESPHICPNAGEGKNHYAMNPNCKYNSPLDMVLLFETKAGWNQHGGPGLFTFDNHDPKGGCVLLNDGTVKFIRTTEELHQLRWK